MAARRKKSMEHTLTSEEFRRDPDAAYAQVKASGRVVLTDADGRPVAVLSSPTEPIAVHEN